MSPLFASLANAVFVAAAEYEPAEALALTAVLLRSAGVSGKSAEGDDAETAGIDCDAEEVAD